MADIRALHAKPIPDSALIATLRELLADAESGALCSLVGIADYHQREPEYITAGVCDWWAMRGRLADLGEDITREDDDEG